MEGTAATGPRQVSGSNKMLANMLTGDPEDDQEEQQNNSSPEVIIVDSEKETTAELTSTEDQKLRKLLADEEAQRELEEMQEERKKRERMEKLSKQILRAGASLRVEQLTLGTIRWILLAIFFLDAMALALGVIISTFSYVSASVRVDGIHVAPASPELRTFVLFAEAIVRTIACSVLTFLFLTYPQRVIRASIDSASWYRWEQGFIIVYIFIMFCTPVYSIFGIVRFWQTVLDFIELVSNFQMIVTINFFATDEAISFAFSIFVTAFWTTFSHLYLHGMVHFQGHPREVLDKEERKELLEIVATTPSFVLSQKPLEATSSVNAADRYRGDGEDTGEVREAKRCWERIRQRCKYRRDQAEHKYLKGRKFIKFRYFGGLDVLFVLALMLYFSLTLALGIVLEFHPSYVPIVSLGTVIRVCSYPSENLTAITNMTLLSSDGDTFFLTYNSTLQGGIGICSYSQPDNRPFWITVTVCSLVFLDVYFFLSAYNKAIKSRKNLWSLPYATTRSNQLGYAYFRVLTWITFAAVGALAIVMVLVEPLSPYLFESSTIIELARIQETREFPHTYNVMLGVKPFNQVGIGPGIFGFGCIYFIYVLWMFFLAYGYLPANSMPGTLGWFCPMQSKAEGIQYGKPDKQTYLGGRQDPVAAAAASTPQHKPSPAAAVVAAAKAMTNPQTSNRRLSDAAAATISALHDRQMLLLAFESDISTLKDIEEEERAKEVRMNRDRLPFLQQIRRRRLQSQKSLMHLIEPLNTSWDAFNEETATAAIGPTLIEEQIAANVLVLETEILMYHFMSLSYDLCDKIEDPDDPTKKRLRTFKEMAAMVEDKRYELKMYAEDEETDTHAFVFASLDRVVVSFRGSVSFKNYQTDWDSAELEFEHGKHVAPLLEDEVNLAYSKTLASKPAFVHGGFVKTYNTVRDRIRDKVRELLEEPGTRRCVLVTGHSLGGVSLQRFRRRHHRQQRVYDHRFDRMARHDQILDIVSKELTKNTYRDYPWSVRLIWDFTSRSLRLESR